MAAMTPERAKALGAQAYLYGFPLLEFLRVRAVGTSVRCPDRGGNAPVNLLSTVPRLATPAARTVVAPNVDTLYSIAHLDLGDGPVVLRHPAMGTRYFSFQLLDPFTNTFNYVGSRTTGARSGAFAITWAPRDDRVPPGARPVVSPSRRVWLIGRTLVRGAQDRRRALGLMRRYRLVAPGAPPMPSGRPGRPRTVTAPTGLAFLVVLGEALADNPPPAADQPLLDELATAGIGPGLRPDRAELAPDVLAALVAGADEAAAALPAIVHASVTAQAAANGGWTDPAPHIGDYGTDYAFRAGVAAAGLGANTREESLYPTALQDADGAPLDGANTYRLVFARGGLPPVRAFWSLTAYDAAGYLVANPLRRYAVGPTHGPLARAADGSVAVHLSRRPPDDPAHTWLPIPDGPFRLSLRLYWPHPAALDGRWRPPPIQRAG